MKVINGVYSGVTTSELDTLAAETAASMTTKHPDYGVLAARVAVSNLHKETEKCFSGWLLWLHMYYTPFFNYFNHLSGHAEVALVCQC